MMPSHCFAQLPHIFYWTLPPTTYQHGLFPVGLPITRPSQELPHNHVPGLPMQELRKPRWGSGWWLAPRTSRLGERVGFERTLSRVTRSEEPFVPILTCSPGPIPPLAVVQDPKQAELGVGLFPAERKEQPPRGLLHHPPLDHWPGASCRGLGACLPIWDAAELLGTEPALASSTATCFQSLPRPLSPSPAPSRFLAQPSTPCGTN